MKFKPQQKIYLLCNTGALGDTVSTFPTVKLLCERGHIEKLFVDDRFLSLYELVFDKEIIVPLSTAMKIIPRQFVTSDVPREVIDPETGDARYLDYPLNPNIPLVYSLRQLPTSVHSHLIDCFSMTICDAILKEQDKNYPYVPIDKLPCNILNLSDEDIKNKSYVVIAYGATTEHRRMLPEVFEGIKNYCLENNLKVVLLGKKGHELNCGGVKTKPTFDKADFTGCINLIDQTTISEALRIIHDAKFIIGLDNGLIHLAGMTNTPIIASYTTVDPYYRLPYRNGIKGHNCFVIEPDSECRYCQTEHFCTYGINFLRCNTMTKECMNSLTLDKYIKEIDKIL